MLEVTRFWEKRKLCAVKILKAMMALPFAISMIVLGQDSLLPA